jgi:hypothetical protein
MSTLIKQFEVKADPTVYYVAISAIQKCIRRGDVERAVNFARLAWQCDPYKVWCRLWVILFEDCARNEQALRAFYEHRKGYNKFEDLMPLVALLANGPHDRMPCSLSCMVNGRDPVKFAHYDLVLRDKFPALAKFTAATRSDPKDALSYYEQFGFEFAFEGHDFSWVVELCRRSLKFDRENFSAAVPFFFSKGVYQATEARIAECAPLTMLWDFLPMECLDGHTRPGKITISTFLKYKREGYPFLTDDKVLSEFVFFNEGWLYRNYDPYPFNFSRLQLEMTPYPGKSDSSAFDMWIGPWADLMRKEVIPELHKVRTWAIEKTCPNEIREMKRLYQADFIKGEDALSSVSSLVRS